MAKKRAERLSALGLLLVSVIWGGGFIAVEWAVGAGLNAASIMMGRFLLGSLATFALFFRKVIVSKRREILHGCLAGLLLFVAFYAQTVGQTKTTVSKTAFITSTNVVMVPFIVWLVVRKRPRLKVFLLAGLTLLGVGILSFGGETGPVVIETGDVLVLLCAVLFAAHIVYLGLVCRYDDPVVITFWQLLTAGVISLALFVLTGGSPAGARWGVGIWPVLFLGLFSTCLCYFIQTTAQTHLPPSKAGILLAMEGLFGSLFSVALGMEPLRGSMILGGVIITASVVLMEADTDRLLRRKREV